ncbi:hypothetical protein ADUPG1_005752, partial [Aduncisulcus paluster]
MGWIVDYVQTWFTPQSYVGMTGSHPRVIYDSVCAKTGLKCRLEIVKDATRHMKAGYFRCYECKATLANVKKLATR